MVFLGNLIAALCVVMILSLLWKENRAYRLGEHILLGLSVGYSVVAAFFEYIKPKFYDPLLTNVHNSNAKGVFTGFVILALGLCWYGVYFKRTEWLMRLVIGIVVGAGAGQAIRIQTSQQMPVLVSSFRSPIVVENGVGKPWESFSNIVFLLALVSVIFFFFFTLDHKNAFTRNFSKFGKFWLMVGFGAFFGNTLMTRLSALIERVWFVVDSFFR